MNTNQAGFIGFGKQEKAAHAMETTNGVQLSPMFPPLDVQQSCCQSSTSCSSQKLTETNGTLEIIKIPCFTHTKQPFLLLILQHNQFISPFPPPPPSPQFTSPHHTHPSPPFCSPIQTLLQTTTPHIPASPSHPTLSKPSPPFHRT